MCANFELSHHRKWRSLYRQHQRAYDDGERHGRPFRGSGSLYRSFRKWSRNSSHWTPWHICSISVSVIQLSYIRYLYNMRPLAASLVFIVIAMIVGVFRQLLFTNTGSNSDDSNIALTKLHTLTVSQHTDSKFSYNSLY